MLGVKSRTTVQRYVSGERLPTASVMRRIEELSGGRVTQADFLDPRPPRCLKVVLDRFGRPQKVYPWTIIERHRLQQAINDNLDDDRRGPTSGPQAAGEAETGLSPPERPGQLDTGEEPERWPSRPLQRALAILGGRVRFSRRGGFLMDGRLVDARRVVAEANRVLKAGGQLPIPYPGVDPLT